MSEQNQVNANGQWLIQMRILLRSWWALVPLLALAVVWAIVLIRSVALNMVWEDEAFNLSVVRNAVSGLGYASDGVLSGNQLAPFDARISTGPVVLLPIILLYSSGLDIIFAGRLVSAAFAVLLVVGLYLVGARMQRMHQGEGSNAKISWVGIVAAAVPLTYNTWLTNSPIQGPADVLGEFAAAACLIWALVCIDRYPWATALLVGLAIQCKFIVLLAVPAYGVGLFLIVSGPFLRRLWKMALAGVLVVTPSIAYEVWAYVVLGPIGYREHLRDFRAFLRGGYTEHNTVGQKLDLLSRAWFVPSWLALIAAVVVIVACLIQLLRWRRRPGSQVLRTVRVGNTCILISSIGLATFFGWWVFSAATPLWVRHPAIGVLSFGAVMVSGAASVLASRRGLLQRPIGVGLALALGALVSVQMLSYLHSTEGPRIMTLDEQRAEANQISRAIELDSGEVIDRLAAQWGRPISVAFVSGARLANLDGEAKNTDGLYRIVYLDRHDLCGSEPILITAHFQVCAPAA